MNRDQIAEVIGDPYRFRDPHCTECGAQYGALHGVDCSYPGTWRESRMALRDRPLPQPPGDAG